MRRRSYLKRAGGIASGSAIVGLGGCLGEPTNNDGSGGSQSDKVTAVIFPNGLSTIISDYVEENNLIRDRLESAGYDEFELTRSFDDATLFASGQADVVISNSTVQAARMAVERDMDLVANALYMRNKIGVFVARDGPYDPNNTGDVQASVDKLVEDGANIGIGGWAGGDIPPLQVTLESYGYSFEEEGGDFPVFTADFFALGDLIANGELAAASTHLGLGIGDLMMTSPPEIVPLFWYTQSLNSLGYGADSFAIGNILCRQEYADNKPEVVEAIVDGYDEATTWAHNADYNELGEEYVEPLAANSAEEAEFVLEHSFTEGIPFIPRSITLTDSIIENDERALSKAEELGAVPEGWNDRLTYRKW